MTLDVTIFEMFSSSGLRGCFTSFGGGERDLTVDQRWSSCVASPGGGELGCAEQPRGEGGELQARPSGGGGEPGSAS